MLKVKMPMTETPFNKITHSTRWQHWAFLVIVQVGILLCAGTYWSIQRVVDQEQRRFKTDFLSLIDYVKEQEQFLHQLKIRSQQLTAPLLPSKTSDVYEIDAPSSNAIRMFEGQSLPIKLPFTFACQTLTECNMVKNSLFSLGSYFSDFYASFWSASYYPAAPIFFVNDTNKLSLSVPAVNAQSVYEHISVENYQDIINYLLRNLQRRDDKSCKLPAKNDNVVWLRIADQPPQLAGVIPIELSPERDHNLSLSQGCLYMAAVVTPSVIRALEHQLNPAPEYRFWLQNREHSWLYNKKHGYLIGESQAPENSHDGMNFTLNGLVFKFTDNTDTWVGIYRIPYSSFFLDHLGLFSATLLLLAFSLLSCFYYMYWYNRHVLVPAKEAQRDILESDTFNRTLIQTAPIALCLISRQTGHVVFANQLALDWLDTEVGQPLSDSAPMKSLLDIVQSASREGRIEQLAINSEKTLYVVYTPTRYQQQSVTLCAFTDISFHAEIERTLTDMRQAADEANKAKSTFLATMSHEIRTPLYGVIGTLELLSLTNQDDQQRQYVRRMEDSSQMLLRIISDILDISKIEAGQLQLELTAFNLCTLVESTVSAYAGMANNKGLLLFSSIATDIPQTVLGDPVRLRQILSNLISNAIKFTHSGYVIIRVSVLNTLNNKPRLLFEVCDSGVGIAPSQQAKLFTPFYIVEHERHSTGGAGLGLSICASLAELMNTKIQLHSEPMMGSIFFFELALEHADGPSLPVPDLQGATLYIRTPHPELTAAVSHWLGRWGGDTIAWRDGEHSPDREAILLDITQSADNRMMDWPGKYIGLSLSGEAGVGEIDAYSMTSIGFGVDRLIHNIANVVPSITLLPRFDLRVLLAEDNPINQVTLQEQLERLGCQVMLAGDGEEALALWDISPYDIVLTDVNMPYLNGYELSRQLRAEGVIQPIIGVTANAMRDEEQRCLEAGMNAWLVKPIEIRQLATLLSQYVAPEHIVDRLPAEAMGGPSADILKKHKQLFLQTMWQDWHQLDEGIRQSDVDEIEMTLHRMRGALVLVDQHALSSQIAVLEENLQTSGLNEVALEQIVVMAKTLHQLLTEIETESLSGTRS